jgi:hypothetical protein
LDGSDKKCTQFFGGQFTWKSHLGGLKRRWDINVEMNFEGMGSNEQKWMEMALDWDQCQPLILVMLSL